MFKPMLSCHKLVSLYKNSIKIKASTWTRSLASYRRDFCANQQVGTYPPAEKLNLHNQGSHACGAAYIRVCRQHNSTVNEDDDPLNDFFENERVLYDTDTHGHDGEKVFIIQPVLEKEPTHLTTPKLQLEESIGLVNSLPNWKVVGHYLETTKDLKTPTVFRKQKLLKLADKIHKLPSITSVFVSLDQLLPSQKSAIVETCGIERVFDRYSLVLQIFRLRVKTKEAKIQVALAELPYMKSIVSSSHASNYQRQSLTGESFKEKVKREFQLKEQKLRKHLIVMKKNRDNHRMARKKSGVPIVAVVGYTNTGKTSLIKALSASESLQPKNQLFATLDVTAHAAVFPNNLRYVLVDTVGFLSHLPHSLFDAFSATMEDMLQADLIVHVRDASHPDRSNQLVNVLTILSQLRLDPKLIENILEVQNKIDIVPQRGVGDGQPVVIPEVSYPKSKKLKAVVGQGKLDLRPAVICRVSATSGTGMTTMTQHLQDLLMKVTGRRIIEIMVPAEGDHFRWLRGNCAVDKVQGEGDYALKLRVIATEAQLNKFAANFTDFTIMSNDFSNKSSVD